MVIVGRVFGGDADTEEGVGVVLIVVATGRAARRPAPDGAGQFPLAALPLTPSK